MTESYGERFHKVLQELPQIKKDSVNPHFKSRYASLGEIMSVAQPICLKHGLSITFQMQGMVNSTVSVVTQLLDKGVKTDIYTNVYMPVGREDAQGVASAITYAKRYGVCMLLGIVPDDDDDGNAAVAGKSNTAGAVKTVKLGG